MRAGRATRMIVGLNRAVEHDRGLAVGHHRAGGSRRDRALPDAVDIHVDQHHAMRRQSFEVRLHEGGGILWSKQVDYRELLGRGLPKDEQDDEVRASMEKTLHTVIAAIARGKLP